MAKLRTDSPISCRIVRAFLDFLNSVDPAPGVDLEGLEVATECLTQVFKIDQSSIDDQSKPDLLVDLFSSLDPSEKPGFKSKLSRESVSTDGSSTSSAQTVTNNNDLSQGSDWTRGPNITGVSEDELFGKFFDALEKLHFFKTTHDGKDDQDQVDKATCIFNDALIEMERSGCQTLNKENLAEALKSQGNRAMQSKRHSDAIELYTFAIALCEDNAVYYCNRAAAYTQIQKYTEAIRDCLKSIDINPNYSKGYSRLGLAYYAQGNYSDAISRGFMKALQLDPNNEAVKENIKVAEQKLREEQQRTGLDQGSSSTSRSSQETSDGQPTGETNSQSAPPPFSSMPFNVGALPADLASMFMNMAANAYQGSNAQDRPAGERNGEPEIRIGGNISVNLGEQMPEELSGALRSVMEMFSGGAPPQGNPRDSMNGGSESS